MALKGGIRTAQQRASCLVGTLFTLPREGAALGEAGANASWAAICSPPGPSSLRSLRTAAVLRAAVAPREHHSSSLKVSGQAAGTPGLRMARGRGGHSLTRKGVAARRCRFPQHQETPRSARKAAGTERWRTHRWVLRAPTRGAQPGGNSGVTGEMSGFLPVEAPRPSPFFAIM